MRAARRLVGEACTVCAASSVSEARALDSAIRSWLSRLSARSRRPSARIGHDTSGTTTSTSAVSFGLVRQHHEPAEQDQHVAQRDRDRRADTDSISVVSVVSRDSTSPVMIRS